MSALAGDRWFDREKCLVRRIGRVYILVEQSNQADRVVELSAFFREAVVLKKILLAVLNRDVLQI